MGKKKEGMSNPNLMISDAQERTRSDSSVSVEAEVAIKPCPFCGEIKWLYTRETYIDGFYIECRGCHLHSPSFDSEILAKEYWNKRVL